MNSGPLGADSLSSLTAADRREVSAAYGKLLRKERLTKKEEAALARFEKDREERLRWQYYRSIPKKHWQKMSGRQVKVINEQAARYSLPLDGPTIDLPRFAMAFHDFLAKHAQRLAAEEDSMLRSGLSPALERYREEKALLARLDRLEREGELLRTSDVYRVLYQTADIIRHALDAVIRRFGDEAADIIDRAFDEVGLQIKEAFGSSEEEAK